MAVEKSDGESGLAAGQTLSGAALGFSVPAPAEAMDMDGESAAESNEDEDEEEAPAAPPRPESGRVRRPSSPWGWVVYPFAVVWRFLFPKKPRPFIVELPFLIVFALFLAFLIKTFLVQAFFIPSGSMQNTLAIGDRVLVNRAAVWIGDTPTRGEVVVFQDPGGWLADQPPAAPSNWLTSSLTYIGVLPQDNGDLIKRVIGVGGDNVICCNAQNQITVNGVPLDETYLYPGDKADSAPSGIDPDFNITVPQGDLWVMGDHRSVSADSRAHVLTDGGFVPVSDVVGRADLIIWPMSQWGTLPVPGTFKQTGLSALAAPGGTPAAALALALPVTGLRRRRKLRNLARRTDTPSGA